MIKRAPRLTIALALLAAIALVTAGSSIAHRIVPKHRPQPTHSATVNPAADDDYVELLIQVTRSGW
jgi:hypothetical protein